MAVKLDGKIRHAAHGCHGIAHRGRVHDPQRVGEAVADSAGFRGGFEDRLQGGAGRTRGVLAAKGNLKPLGPRIADHILCGGHHGTERSAEFGGDLRARNGRGEIDDADAGRNRIVDVAAPHPAPGHDPDRQARPRDAPDRLLLGLAHRGRAGLDLVNARVRERSGDVEFLRCRERDTRRLLAIS